MYRAIPHLSPIGLSVIHQADEKHVDITFQRIKTRSFVEYRMYCLPCAQTTRSSSRVKSYDHNQ